MSHLQLPPRPDFTFLAINGHHWVSAIEPDAANDGELGICPIQALIVIINSQTCKQTTNVDYKTLQKS